MYPRGDFLKFCSGRGQQNYCSVFAIWGLDLSGTELSYRLCLLFEGMGMEDWGVVEGVSYPYVVKGHLVSG